MIQIPMINDDDKMIILSRLVREGHITLEEAFILSDRQQPTEIYPLHPYTLITTPEANPKTIPYPWFTGTTPFTGTCSEPVFTYTPHYAE